MELESLKGQINRRLEDPVGELPSEVTSRSVRSRSLLLRLRRNLRIELALYLPCLGYVAWQMWRSTHTAVRIYDATFLCMVLVIMWRIREVIRRIGHHLQAGISIRDHLAALLGILEDNRRKYMILSVFILPFFVIYAVLLFHFFPIHGRDMPAIVADPGQQDPPFWVFLVVWVILTALLMGAMYLISRLYIWWMFGKHIHGLRESLRDLESDAEADTESAV
jgi:hypothetical protein